MPLFYLNIALDTPLPLVFDYLPLAQTQESDYCVGQRVIAPFGRLQKTGVIVSMSSNTQLSTKKLKSILKRLDDTPIFSDKDCQLISWAAHYYHQPLGEVFTQALPKQLRTGPIPNESQDMCYALSATASGSSDLSLKRAPRQASIVQLLQQRGPLSAEELNATFEWNWRPALNKLIEKQWLFTQPVKAEQSHQLVEPNFLPNLEQQAAIDHILQKIGSFQAYLLDGVTGSGKTEVYLQLIQKVLLLGQQILVLLPEINLTPQLAFRFKQRLACQIEVYHSGLSDTQRTQAWIKCRSGSASILLGTRSSIFTPMKNLGLIILDEEHDSSFKQQEGFRYSARDIAIIRARNLGIPIVMGSATPSLEALYNVQQKRFQHLLLPNRTGQAVAPSIHLIDIRNKKLDNHLSKPLLAAIDQCLECQEQVILFVNRRGFAPVLMCHCCGWVAQCKNCDARLVTHQQQQLLKCHHCGAEHRKPHRCPSCQQAELFPLGTGTERIEDVLTVRYPTIPITRIDRDTTRRKDAMQSVIDKVHQGGAQILVGTQMLAKGHHFPNVTLVGIIDMDAGLFSIDYRASERTAQLLTQVAGRAGRENKPGKVLIQTHNPDHPLFQTLKTQSYAVFAQQALTERQDAQLPPYHYQALLRVNATQEADILQFMHDTKNQIDALQNSTVSVLGPVPSPMLKRAGRFRYQLLFESSTRKARHHFLQQLLPHIKTLKSSRKIRWSIDVDPIDLY